MRRQFRQDLLITSPPPKPKAKPRKRKNPNKKCDALRLLMRRYISEAGSQNINRDEWAEVCDVHKKTLDRWIYGYPPQDDLIYKIARYLSPKLQRSKIDIHLEICKTLSDWREGS